MKSGKLSRSDAALVAAMRRRILGHWDAATAEELADGLAWYGRAGDLADALAAGAPISRETAAGVIAALSPRCSWGSNVKGATAFVDAFALGASQPVVAGTRTNRSKGWAVLQSGGDPLDVLGGPKVRAFYSNICGDLEAVTVDVWAARAAEGARFKDAAPAGKRYRLIALAYQQAADVVGQAPRDVQAAVWVHYRRKYGRELD